MEPDVIVIYHAGAELTVDTRDLAVAAGLAEPKQEESWLMRNSMTWFLLEKNWRYVRRARQKEASAARLDYDAKGLAQAFCARLIKLLRASREVAPVVAVATYSTRMRPPQSEEAFRRRVH